ncbi:TerC/Alx family metal homeostasis membrane protein [Hafnia alvei]|uniref:TerC/Alx family metal homeostasis membrane protein n=1 Tax=Hafnia alvei TaxID=569 RepID=UPI000B72D292|nr:TerC/Alx family metal homeostasis membrane protein [Hafnia alvei]MBI0275441.1 TerC/Alx family metal homeostasis membrane protein [Hafnia alvei]PNK98564.1 tellurium resistance protein TerC [Hafnia alvei]
MIQQYADMIVFFTLAAGMFLIDMLCHRGHKPVSIFNATMWTLAWFMVAGVFAGYLYVSKGSQLAFQFVSGYALEETLSVDNIFAIMAVFAWFNIPNEYRHRVLHFGIIGAIVFRGIFVVLGTSMLNMSAWVEVLFAAFILYTAYAMVVGGNDEETDFSHHPATKLVHRFYPVWPKLVAGKFFHFYGRSYATPLFLCLVVIELSDVMFSFDSVPAVLSVSHNSLVVYSAMMFAILGLRSMYFILEAAKSSLVHLEKAVVVLLIFVAGKLALSAYNSIMHKSYELSASTSLFIVLAILAAGIVASLAFPSTLVGEEK